MKRIVPEYRKIKRITRRDYKKLENSGMLEPMLKPSRADMKYVTHHLKRMAAKGLYPLLATKDWGIHHHEG